MVIGIFCHYLPIYKDVNGVYCSTTLTDELFKRYLKVVDRLIVATRVYPINKSYQEAHQEKITLKRVEILEFPNLSDPRILITGYFREKRKLEAAVRQSDLIFIRGGIIAQMGVDAARKYKKPYLLESAGCAWDEYWNYSFTGKLLAPYMEYRAKRDTRNADYVIYVTERWLQSRYPTKGKSTHASNVIVKEIDDGVLEKRMNKIKGQKSKKIILGTTGGVGNKAKGQQFVIQTISELKEKYDISYELVGGGSNDYLKSMAKKYNVEDRVFFKGQLTHEEVLNWLDDVDIYIQPSLQEGLPRALIEAMSRACPAIGSTTAGIPELLEDGCIFRRGDQKDLKRVLKVMLEADKTRNAVRNFDKAKEYELQRLNRRREKIYKAYRQEVTGDMK